jgi:outer membrane receptor protein involved in Fe transport
MTRFGLLGTSAIGSATFIALTVAAAAPAYAQSDPATHASQTSDAASGAAQTDAAAPAAQAPESNTAGIVVTGTRIRRPNLSSPVPITSMTAEELPEQGQASIGDALNDLPSLRSTFSQQNSGASIGTAGENFLDLRGLGTTRTLVLVNGRRHVTESVGNFVVDVNTIPQELVERIDIVTGGEAAVYGSDAVAGVVNFVLKRDFNGLRFRVQDGVSSRGDRPIQVATMTAGRNFADGRGNIAVSLEYTKAASLYTRDRDNQTGAFSGRCGFQLVENTTAESRTASNSDGVADRNFICGGLNSAALSNGGTIGQFNAAGDFLRFDNNGNLFVDHPTTSFLALTSGLSGNQLGGQGSTLEDTGQLAVGQTRYVANLLFHYDFSQALQFFLEGTFVRQDVVQEGQPSFFQGGTGTFFRGSFAKGGVVPNLTCSNAFLTAQNLTTLINSGATPGLAVNPCAAFTPAVAAAPGRAAVPAAFILDANGNRVLNPNGAIPLSRFDVDFGGRGEFDRRQTFRIVGGFQGDFHNTWHWEASVNYGRYTSTNVEQNNLVFADLNNQAAGFALAIDAVRNAAGQIVCRVNQVTVTNPGCVPINLFGNAQPSQAALNFVNTTSFLYSHATELDALATLSGDTAGFFSLPGGPVGFAIGAEYRRETAGRHADPLSANGGTFFNAFGRFAPPAFAVKEVFGELNIPFIKDVPFFHELSVSGAARYSDYNTSAKHTFAWNVNGIWSPVADLRLRANYSKSVRVPTLADLFSPASQNFALIADPCDSGNIGGGPNRRANCAALGVPTTVLASSPCAASAATPAGSPFVNCTARAASVGFLSSGNPHLTAETGKSLTIGGVLTPRFMPGFSLSVDYFNIKVSNLIATLTAQTILNQCVDLPNVNNQFCQLLFPRDANGLFGNPALISGGVNFAKQTSRGIDFDLAYRHTFSSGFRFGARGVATWTMERNNFTSPTSPGIATHQLGTLGDPFFSANLQLTMGQGPWDLSTTFRYIGRQTVTTWEATHSFQGRPPTDPDFSDIAYYPQIVYVDMRFSYKVNSKFRFYMGVDNLTDRLPPLGDLGSVSGDPFTAIGRYFYGGAQVEF